MTEDSECLYLTAAGEGTIAEALAMWRAVAARLETSSVFRILFENRIAPPKQPDTTMLGYDFALEFLKIRWKPEVVIAVVCTPERYNDMVFTLEVIMNRSQLVGQAFTDFDEAERWLKAQRV